jgi:broad specificity phosphatase PhoE
MSILLVRHGETAGNAARVLQVATTPLNERGQQQAALLARRLHELGASQLVCSDLTRAQMTAEPIAKLTGLVAELSPLLQERNFGELRGTAYGDVGPQLFSADYVPPGGESNETFHARVASAFAWILQVKARTPGNLIVVTHGLVCGALLERHATLAAGHVIERISNCSLTELDAEAPHGVRLLNCTKHLDDHPELAGHPSLGAV